MIAAWYDHQGPPAEVLQVGELPVAEPGPGDVRVRLTLSEAAAQGALSIAVAGVFPLAQIAAAHELIESGRAAGRVLVSLP